MVKTAEITLSPTAHSTVVIDGICVFCNAAARFIIRRDPRGKFKFCHFQSLTGRALLAENGCDPECMDSLVLIDHNGVSFKSDAALRIVASLRFPWPLLRVLSVLPRGFRDYFYDGFAARRYRWFGQSDQCIVPDAGLKSRFVLDDGAGIASAGQE